MRQSIPFVALIVSLALTFAAAPTHGQVVHRAELKANDILTAVVPVSPDPEGDIVSPIPEGGIVSTQETLSIASPAQERAGWVLQATLPKVLMGVSFCDPQNGFIATELGGVYRTTNGGVNWVSVMNLGFPYYWYGVHCFTPQRVMIVGFQNQTGAGIIRWSDNGGATWTADIVLDPANWLLNVRFADADHGIAYGYSGYVYVTTNGGRTAADWTKILADPTQGWFAGNISFRPDLHVAVTGISLCRSTNGGLTWSRRASADAVFDNGVSFPDDPHGWTGGGQISDPIQGWVNRSTDGGNTWTGRLLHANWPIRVVQFFDDRFGFAVGGTRFGNAGGGIWLTTDAGNNWSLDADTGAEMSAVDSRDIGADSPDVWCVGFLPSFNGVVYKKRIPRHAPGGLDTEYDTPRIAWAAPNPFTLQTRITAVGNLADVLDPSGRVVRQLRRPASSLALDWDGADDSGRPVPAGVYFLRFADGPSSSRGLRITRLR
jgi:photosystem II stability/assembly factor-like uncharacterized protein